MASLVPVKGEPGQYLLGGKKISLVEWREDWRYDTRAIVGSGAASILSAGQTWEFFRDLSGKDRIDCNITQQRRISRGEQMVINNIGAFICGRLPGVANQCTNEVFHYIAERFYLEFKINKDTVMEGPLLTFQSGLGVSGYSSDVAPDGNILSLGVPSLAAVRPLLVNQEINSDHDIEATMTHFGAGWLTTESPAAGALVPATIAAANAVAVRLMLNGYIKKAMGRG